MEILEPFYKDSTIILEDIENSLDKGVLYLGNIKSAQPYQLAPKQIKAVLTLTKESKIVYDDPNIKHARYDVQDVEQQNLKCIQFIEENLKVGNVLVHCMAGVSRSATIVIAYLMKKNKLSYEEAFRFVKTKRVIVWPNDGFIEQLKLYEKQLNE